MKRVFFFLVGVLFVPACNGAIGAGPLDPVSGMGGSIAAGSGNGGSSGAVADQTGTAGVTAIQGVAGSGAGASGTAGASGAAGAVGGCSGDGLPADVQALLMSRCIACHGNPPLPGVPTSLTTYAALTATSKTDPTRTNAQLAILRMQSTAMPMPPTPLTRATSAEIATLQQWVAAGSPRATCAGGTDGGAPIDAGPIVDPFAAAPVCTSNHTWTSGNHGSSSMNPGLACVSCHSSRGEGPRFALAGTLYPTAHEPDLCDGVNGGAVGAQVVIVDANGQSITMTPNSAGNFSWEGNLATPYQAKVIYMGRERAMIESQTSGDCNNCHTQQGAMPTGTTKAPGRILLP